MGDVGKLWFSWWWTWRIFKKFHQIFQQNCRENPSLDFRNAPKPFTFHIDFLIWIICVRWTLKLTIEISIDRFWNVVCQILKFNIFLNVNQEIKFDLIFCDQNVHSSKMENGIAKCQGQKFLRNWLFSLIFLSKKC